VLQKPDHKALHAPAVEKSNFKSIFKIVLITIRLVIGLSTFNYFKTVL